MCVDRKWSAPFQRNKFDVNQCIMCVVKTSSVGRRLISKKEILHLHGEASRSSITLIVKLNSSVHQKIRCAATVIINLTQPQCQQKCDKMTDNIRSNFNSKTHLWREINIFLMGTFRRGKQSCWHSCKIEFFML